MELFFSKYTSRGGRPVNEDSIGLCENMAVVADGLGGQGEGDIASKACVDFFLGMPFPERIDDEKMHSVIDEANAYVYRTRINYGNNSKMATTVVAAFVKDGKFNYLNVGDSRMYFFRRGKIMLQSKDHSVTQSCVDTGQIKASQMRFHEDRNKLTKALGLSDTLKVLQSFQEFAVRPGDAFLLCTDGFWEYVLEKDMEKALKKSLTPQDWMNHMLKKIKKNAPDGCDNQSAIAAMVK